MNESGRPASAVLIVLSAVLYLGAAVTGTFIAVKVDPGLGLLALVIVLTTAPIAGALLSPRRGPGNEMDATIDSIVAMVPAPSAVGGTPDEARQIENRHAIRDALRRAIEEEIAAQDFDAAMVLIDRLATEHGLLQEAEAFRHRIEETRSPAREADLHEAILQLDELLAQRRWDVAAADAGRIVRLYPESPKAQRLHERVEQARNAHKAELERRFVAATEEGRTDDAMAILKKLDEFLTEVEAEPLRELARGIITQTRETLGAEFRQAVQDRRWSVAAEVGTRIVSEFPNTRMAAEVREVIDGIRGRAANPGAGAP